MGPYALLAMVGLFVVTVTSPGPNTFLVLQSRLDGGIGAAERVIAGICTGELLWGMGAVLGLAALLELYPQGVTLMQLAGATWFFVAGWRGLVRFGDLATQGRRRSGGFAGGFASSALNPNTAILFAAAMPTLLVGTTPSFARAAAIGVLFAGMGATWFSTIAGLAGRGQSRVLDPRVTTVLRRIPSFALMGFGFLFVIAA